MGFDEAQFVVRGNVTSPTLVVTDVRAMAMFWTMAGDAIEVYASRKGLKVANSPTLGKVVHVSNTKPIKEINPDGR